MPRPISWQPRLRDIHQQVKESPRDPYHRADLERLFRLQRRAAHALLELMPRQSVGSSTVIEREDLLAFLGGALDAEDLAGYLNALRAEPPKPKRRKLRVFVPRDFEPGNIRSLAPAIRMDRGIIELNFETLEQAVSLLHQLSTVVETPEFEKRYCRPPALSPAAAVTRQEVDELYAELERMEQQRAEATPPDGGEERTFLPGSNLPPPAVDAPV